MRGNLILSLTEIIMTRIFQICLGYEDVNDCDDTNVDTYGCQELTFFNGYYDSYCYMPLMVFEGHSGKMILPLLKPGRAGKSVSFEDTILWLIACLREAWPKTVITVRGDSHFCSHELMVWASLNDRKVFFITGLARSSVLQDNPVTQAVIERVKHDYDLYRRPVRSFGEFGYKACTWPYLPLCRSIHSDALCR